MTGIRDKNLVASPRMILPNPDADILWKGNRPPMLAAKAARLQIRAADFHRLAVGNSATLPGGQILVLDVANVNEDHVQFTAGGNPIPFIVVRQPDGWRLDAGPIIAGQKDAQAAKNGADENGGDE